MSEHSEQSSQVQSEEQQKQKLKKKSALIILPTTQTPPPNSRITINLSLTQYDVIEQVAQELGWRLLRNPKPNSTWDVLWADHHIHPELLIKMQLFQKVSHFPGIHVLSRKNLLGLSLMDMYKRAPQHYNFFPKTWLLPAQYSDLRKEFVGEQKTFIVKPEADCQGRGIFLTQKVQQVQNGQHYVVQQYIARPFLVDGLKFDLRIYVLLCGVSPLRLYIYEQGLARFATEQYVAPSKANLKKQYMHLTNYAINKKNPKFIYNSSTQRLDVGHKRSLTSIMKIIQKRGYNLKQVKSNINDAITKTIFLGHPLVAHQYRFCQPHDQKRNICFHILGIDIMLDSECKPYVLEVNHTPSFVTDTPLDYHIKYSLIKDTLVLMNVTIAARNEALEQMHKLQKEKTMSRQKRQLYQNFDKQEKVKAAQLERDQYQSKNLGRFAKIYPVQDKQKMEIYEQLLETAEKSYFAESNVLRAQMEKQKASEQANIIKEQKKRTIGQESSSPQRLKKTITIDKGSIEIEKASQSYQRIIKRQRVGSFNQSKSKKLGVMQLKEIEQQLLHDKNKNDIKVSNLKHSLLNSRSTNPKTLPKLFGDSPSKQSTYIAYRKKKVQLMKIRQDQKEGSHDLRTIKDIIVVSKSKKIRKSLEQSGSSDEEG